MIHVVGRREAGQHIQKLSPLFSLDDPIRLLTLGSLNPSLESAL